MDKWMRAWMPSDKSPNGTLHLSRFADPMYFLLKPITWTPNPEQDGYPPVTVPVGFVTDFASIPRVFWSLLRPDGLYTYPAIVHDFLYWEQPVARDVADRIFKLGMEDFGVDAAIVAACYNAVRGFGQSAWADSIKLKSRGEKRVLTHFPNDPRVRWDQWKNDVSNFM
jgi:hypothetical protein